MLNWRIHQNEQSKNQLFQFITIKLHNSKQKGGLSTVTVHYYKQTRYKLLRTFCVVAQRKYYPCQRTIRNISQPTVSDSSAGTGNGEKLLERRALAFGLHPRRQNFYQLNQPIAAGIDGLRETL